MAHTDKVGLFTVDFRVNEFDQDVSVFNVKAIDAENAEKIARYTLNPAMTYTCTGTDRVRDAR